MKVFDIKKKTEYETLPIEPGKYLVLSEVDDFGDIVNTGENSTTLQAVKLTYYGEAIGRVLTFKKEKLKELQDGGYLFW